MHPTYLSSDVSREIKQAKARKHDSHGNTVYEEF